jgi:phosphopentomutase
MSIVSALRNRVILVVLDSVGIGEMPDAEKFGDQGADTLGNLSRYFPEGLSLPDFQKLGLGNIAPLKGVPPSENPLASYGKCAEASPAKDTTLGHWEITGVTAKNAFPTYPDGFPPEIIDPFCERTGKGILGNYPSSGTEILKILGEEHLDTGKPIVYTSADSVFQIAAHEDLYPPEKLYELCLIARELLTGKHSVGRVIARPFTGKPGNLSRTVNRRDFSVIPPKNTLLDHIKNSGGEVVGIGKIGDIFAHRGITHEIHTHSNAEGISETLKAISEYPDASLIFTNLVDFDMLYGHRNNPEGYRDALVEFDKVIPLYLKAVEENALLILTADHEIHRSYQGICPPHCISKRKIRRESWHKNHIC